MSRFDEDLASLTAGMVEMTGLAARAISRASTALLEGDLELAESVIADDERIDAWQWSLDDDIVTMMTKHGALVGDLRRLVSGLRVTADLERMGDLARHLAQVTRLKYPEPVVPEPVTRHIAHMGEVAERIAFKTGDVLARQDVQLAHEVDRIDDEMDRLHRELFTVMLSPRWEQPVSVAIDVTLIGRFYERFADHAVNVANQVLYQVTGQDPDRISGRGLPPV
ncbi:phosphate signaling complex protein PhoU [Aquipuribacter sp. MA13-6]|uniref:phosphate signaling complex protein PhoU n=1 Tax=unclassified Aquipuribacter TaxID=2635084 RepID=UPI003EEB2B2B